MALNYIWIGFILVAFAVALCKLIFLQDTDVFTQIISSTFDSARMGFDVSIGLTGILSLWLGLMKIGEKAGLIHAFARFASPVFGKLFPELPKDHPAAGSIFMNISANMLGLDNAATPIGLRAMQQLQELNPKKDTASNAMIMFLNINASGLTIIPITIMMYRAQYGAANPSDIFLPILLTTFVSTLVAIIAVGIVQKINLFQRNLLLFFLGAFAFIGSLVWFFRSLPQEKVSLYSTLFANALLFSIICGFIVCGVRKRLNVYDAFIEGAKEGFLTAVKIIPYLVAILVAIGGVPGVGSDGLSRRRAALVRNVRRFGRHVCGRCADHADEAVERQRSARHDVGCDGDVRSRFVRGAAGLRGARLDGYGLLRRGRLLRQRSHP